MKGGIKLGNELCIGRKEIIAFFQECGIISKNIPTHEAAWIKILTLRKKYCMGKLFHKHYNGKPKIIKEEFKDWLLTVDLK